MKRGLRDLSDRQAITDCLHRYARGVDRLDRELVLSAYHEDAIDHHTDFTVSPSALVEWFWNADQQNREATQHYITNITIDLDGDTAHVESYFMEVRQMRGESAVLVQGGRYADRFERRTEWRIALRHAIVEWAFTGDADAFFPAPSSFGRGSSRDRRDVSYQRPLGQSPPST